MIKKQNENEFTRDEIYDTFNKISTLYNKNANIIYSFCKKKYFDDKINKVFYYRLSYKKDFSPEIIITSHKWTVTFLLNEEVKIITPKKIIRDINNLGTKREKQAYETLKEIIPLLNDYRIKYKNQKGKIHLTETYSDNNNKIWVKSTPDESVLFQTEYYGYVEKNTLKIEDDLHLDQKENNPKLHMLSLKKYQKLLNCITSDYDKKENDFLFASDDTILDKYKYRSLEEYDLSDIDLDDKNISGLNISHNPEIRINFDKIIKDISECNFNGYNLKKEVLRDFNIKDTDLRNTGATIDLATCSISKEGKMNRGTLFDEDNTFLFFNEKLTAKQVKELNIKVYKKEK